MSTMFLETKWQNQINLRKEIKMAITENLADFRYSKTERRPMILPIIIEKNS